MSEYEKFIQWLAERSEVPFTWQCDIASTLLNMPFMSGRTWILERLAEWDKEA